MSEPREKDLSDLERLLASLPPRPPSIDRDRLMFRAGQVSTQGRRWFWPLCALFASVVACCFGVMLLYRPMPETKYVPIVQTHPLPAPSQDLVRPEVFTGLVSEFREETLSPNYSCWQMQQQALRFGPESLPMTCGAANPSPAALSPDPIEGADLLRPKRLPTSWSSLFFGER